MKTIGVVIAMIACSNAFSDEKVDNTHYRLKPGEQPRKAVPKWAPCGDKPCPDKTPKGESLRPSLAARVPAAQNSTEEHVDPADAALLKNKFLEFKLAEKEWQLISQQIAYKYQLNIPAGDGWDEQTLVIHRKKK